MAWLILDIEIETENYAVMFGLHWDKTKEK